MLAIRRCNPAARDQRPRCAIEPKTVFTYAHPLFWAPYSNIGDGGGT
jgi:hypothetical protein